MTMKKLTALIVPLVLILLSAWSKKSNNDDAPRINLSSNLILPPTIIAETGCTTSVDATVEITNPTESETTAEFRLGLYLGTSLLSFKVMAIDNIPAASQNSFQYFKLPKGSSSRVKIQFSVGGSDFEFNKTNMLKAFIYPRRYNRNNFSFYDDDKTNDMLTKELFIGSPNGLCFKCIETEIFPTDTDYGFFVPDAGDYDPTRGCEKALNYLRETGGELLRSGTNVSGSYFKMLPGGNIANTAVRTYLIRNNNGKYLTYAGGVPKFSDLIQNDVHGYQKWVIKKETKKFCGDKSFTLIQYLDGNNCKTLMLNYSIPKKVYLSYRDGIITSPQGNFEKIIIGPAAEKSADTR